MEEHHMAKTIRKFSDQEKMRYLAEYKALRMAEGITVEGFAARAGISHNTFSNWLYGARGTNSGALVRIGNASAAPPRVEVSIEYFDAVIRTDLDHLASVLGIIRNA